VTDEFPSFFLPRMVRSAAAKVPVHLEHVDSNGLLPLRVADKAFTTASSFRLFLQKQLRPFLGDLPTPDPLARLNLPRLYQLPEEAASRWPPASLQFLRDSPAMLANLSLDHSVSPVPYQGGWSAARKTLTRFLDTDLERYAELANHPDHECRSGLSPYLHFGHLSCHEVFHELMSRSEPSEGFALQANGRREGWWGQSPSAEAFLDQLVTWRELGFNMCSQREDYSEFNSLPEWALKTLTAHAADQRNPCYRLDDLEGAETYDTLWNATQTQLLREGRIHNYLRMLWGKKILEWSASPQEALTTMIHLNNKYAVDGRDPNSYSGIFWILGRYDRPWGPERPIFGTVRYMSSENTARKLRVKKYLARYSPSSAEEAQGSLFRS